jgi:hypothetical protein
LSENPATASQTEPDVPRQFSFEMRLWRIYSPAVVASQKNPDTFSLELTPQWDYSGEAVLDECVLASMDITLASPGSALFYFHRIHSSAVLLGRTAYETAGFATNARRVSTHSRIERCRRA